MFTFISRSCIFYHCSLSLVDHIVDPVPELGDASVDPGSVPETLLSLS